MIGLLRLLSRHHSYKLRVVNLTVTVNISLSDHLIYLIISKLHTEIGYDVSKFSSRDLTITISIENLEGFLVLLLLIFIRITSWISIMIGWPRLLSCHHSNKLLIVNLTITVNIGLSDHLIYFLVCKLHTEIVYDMSKLSSRNLTITISIEDLEGFLVLLLLIFIRMNSWIPIMIGWSRLPSRHHSNKLLIVNLTITVNISWSDHLTDFLISKLHTEID